MLTKISSARQRSLSNQLYDQSLSNNSVNSGSCNVLATTVALATVKEQRKVLSGGSWWDAISEKINWAGFQFVNSQPSGMAYRECSYWELVSRELLWLQQEERMRLEAVTRGLVKTELTKKTCGVVSCRVCEIAIALNLIVVGML
jgi:hypothetical protein